MDRILITRLWYDIYLPIAKDREPTEKEWLKAEAIAKERAGTDAIGPVQRAFDVRYGARVQIEVRVPRREDDPPMIAPKWNISASVQ